MCVQIKSLVWNLIWGDKTKKSSVKVRWDVMTLPMSQGGLTIIDPKTQAKALLAKLVVWGLSLGEELWKDLL
jgi:hypothetical protein